MHIFSLKEFPFTRKNLTSVYIDRPVTNIADFRLIQVPLRTGFRTANILSLYFLFLIPPTKAHKCVTIILEITNKLLRHVSTHEVSSSGSSLVTAKITYACIEMCKL